MTKSVQIRNELLALRDRDGLLHVENAVEWARRNKNSALHKELEWNDAVAAASFREDQVRRLIALHIVDAGGNREMVSLSIDRPAGGGYRHLQDVLPDPTLRDVMLEDCLKDLERLQLKYSRLGELSRVWAAKDVVKRKVTGRGKRIAKDRRPEARA